eukprot:5014230-Pyramimonas_sp.AAC.1
MPLESAAVQALVATAPEGKFLALSVADMEKWTQFVADANEPTCHPELFYGCVARLLAENMGSAVPADCADAQMRTFVVD